MKSKSLATEKTKQAIKAPLTIWKASLPFFLGAVLFLMVCLCSASTIKPATMVLAVGVPILTFLCFTQLRDRMGVPLLLLAAVVLMDGISTLYAVSGKFALYEFLKVLASFCLVLFLLAIAPGKGVQPGRWIATLLETCAALASPGEYRYALHPVDQYPGPGAPGAVYPGLQRSLRGGGRCPHDLHF